MAKLHIDTVFNENGITDQIKNIQKAATDTVNAVTSAAKQVSSQLNESQKVIAQAIVDDAKSIKKEIVDTQCNIDSLTEKLEKLKEPSKKENGLSAEVERSTKTIDDMTAAIEKADEALAEEEHKYDELIHKMRELEEANSRLNRQIAMAPAQSQERENLIGERKSNDKDIKYTTQALLDQEKVLKRVDDVAYATREKNEKAIQKEKDNIDDLNKKLEEEKNKRIATASAIESSIALEENRKSDLTKQMKEKVDAFNELTEAVDEADESVKQLDEDTENLGDDLKKTSDSTEDLVGGSKNMKEIIKALPEPIRNVIVGIQGMTRAALAFLATPIGMFLGAVSLALSAVFSWFKSTTIGEEKFAKMTGYLNGVLTTLNKYLVKAGEHLYSLFREPKKLGEEFVEFLKSQFLNRIKATVTSISYLGQMFKDLFSGDWDELATDAKKFSEAWIDGFTGVNDTAKKTSKLFNEIADDASKTGDAMKALYAREYQLETNRSAWALKRQQLETERAKLMEEMSDGTSEQQIAAAQKIISLNNQIANGNRKIAQEAYDIIHEKNKLGPNNQADIAKENDALAELNRVDAENAQANRSMKRRISNLGKVIRDTTIAYTEEQKAALEKMKRVVEDNENELEQANINALAAGAERMRRQRELDHKKAMQQIERQHMDEVEAARKSAIDMWKKDETHKNDTWNDNLLNAKANGTYDSLSDNDKFIVDMYQSMLNAVNDKTRLAIGNFNKGVADEERNAMNQFILTYGDYTQQLEAAEQQRQEKLKNARTQGEANTINAEADAQIEEINKKFGQSGSKLQSMWKDVSKKSRNEIQGILNQLKVLRDQLKDGKIDKDEEGLLAQLGFTPDDIEKLKNGQMPITEIEDKIDSLEDKLKSTGTVFDQVGDAWEKLMKDMAPDKLEAFIGTLSNASSQCMMLAEGVANIGAAFGDSDVKRNIEDVGNVIQSTLSMAGAGASVGGAYGAIAGAVIGLGSGIASIVTEHADDAENKRIKQLDDQVKSLTKSYNELERAINKTYSKDRKANIESEISNLGRQNALIQEQIRLENSKKDRDEGAIQSYQDQIYQNTQRIKELREAAKDAIFGSDINSAIDGFANAYADAWAQNTNRTRTAKEQVREMMQNMVKESIKAAVESSGAMEKIRRKLTDFYKDGLLSQAEQNAIYLEAEAIKKELDNRFGWADDLLDNNASFTQNATSGGFATMNQQSADELNGRFASMQMSIYETITRMDMLTTINKSMETIQSEMNDTVKEVRDISLLVNNNVEDMATYTKSIPTFGEKFDRMNRTLETL